MASVERPSKRRRGTLDTFVLGASRKRKFASVDDGTAATAPKGGTKAARTADDTDLVGSPASDTPAPEDTGSHTSPPPSLPSAKVAETPTTSKIESRDKTRALSFASPGIIVVEADEDEDREKEKECGDQLPCIPEATEGALQPPAQPADSGKAASVPPLGVASLVQTAAVPTQGDDVGRGDQDPPALSQPTTTTITAAAKKGKKGKKKKAKQPQLKPQRRKQVVAAPGQAPAKLPEWVGTLPTVFVEECDESPAATTKPGKATATTKRPARKRKSTALADDAGASPAEAPTTPEGAKRRRKTPEEKAKEAADKAKRKEERAREVQERRRKAEEEKARKQAKREAEKKQRAERIAKEAAEKEAKREAKRKAKEERELEAARKAEERRKAKQEKEDKDRLAKQAREQARQEVQQAKLEAQKAEEARKNASKEKLKKQANLMLNFFGGPKKAQAQSQAKADEPVPEAASKHASRFAPFQLQQNMKLAPLHRCEARPTVADMDVWLEKGLAEQSVQPAKSPSEDTDADSADSADDGGWHDEKPMFRGRRAWLFNEYLESEPSNDTLLRDAREAADLLAAKAQLYESDSTPDAPPSEPQKQLVEFKRLVRNLKTAAPDARDALLLQGEAALTALLDAREPMGPSSVLFARRTGQQYRFVRLAVEAKDQRPRWLDPQSNTSTDLDCADTTVRSALVTKAIDLISTGFNLVGPSVQRTVLTRSKRALSQQQPADKHPLLASLRRRYQGTSLARPKPATESCAENKAGVVTLRDRALPRMKLLQFQEDRRPAYFGTWSKTSRAISGRRPHGRDTGVEYDYDSEADWEEEPEEGDDIGSADEVSDDEEAGEEAEGDWLVPHGYLSEDEGAGVDPDDGDDDDDLDAGMLVDVTPVAPSAKPAEKPLKAVQPYSLGCKFGAQAAENSHLSKFRLVALVPTPIDVDFTPVEVPKEPKPTRKPTEVPPECLADLARLVHGSNLGMDKLVAEFLATHPDVPKSAVVRKIKDVEFSMREKRDPYVRKLRFVSDQALEALGLQGLALPDPPPKKEASAAADETLAPTSPTSAAVAAAGMGSGKPKKKSKGKARSPDAEAGKKKSKGQRGLAFRQLTAKDMAWVRQKDVASGKEYYYNSVTKKSTWDRPAPMDAIEREQAEQLARQAERRAAIDLTPTPRGQGCPNKWNAAHECSAFCQTEWGEIIAKPDSSS